MKQPLVRGVHYIPEWADRDRIADGPSARVAEREEFKRERAKPQKRELQRRPAIAQAIADALSTTFSRAVTISILIEAKGGIVSHEELGQTINHANTAIANARNVLGKGAVINHPGLGYSLQPSVRESIIERAGLTDV